MSELRGVQVELSQAQEGLRHEWQRAQAAAGKRSEAMERLEEARSAARGKVEELGKDAQIFSAAYSRLLECKAEELEVPADSWIAAECKASLGNKTAASIISRDPHHPTLIHFLRGQWSVVCYINLMQLAEASRSFHLACTNLALKCLGPLWGPCQCSFLV